MFVLVTWTPVFLVDLVGNQDMVTGHLESDFNVNGSFLTNNTTSMVTEKRTCIWDVHANKGSAIFVAVVCYHGPSLVIVVSYILVFFAMRKSRLTIQAARKSRKKSLTVFKDLSKEEIAASQDRSSVETPDNSLCIDPPRDTSEEGTSTDAHQVRVLTAGKSRVTFTPGETGETRVTYTPGQAGETQVKYTPGQAGDTRLKYTPGQAGETRVSYNPGHMGETWGQSSHLQDIHTEQGGKITEILPKMLVRRLRRAITRKEKRIFRSLTAILITYLICWSPFHLMLDIQIIGGEYMSREFYSYHGYAVWLCYANSAINPVIYAFVNKDFRIAFKNVLMCRCRDKHREGKYYM